VGSPPSANRRPSSRRHGESSAAGTLADVTELPPTISVEHAAKLLGVSRSAAYRAVAAGQLPNLRLGRRIYIPTARLLAMLGVSAEERR
jgi:excisionase family DNA binding protein